jgi:hypothetical protein
MAWPLLDTSEHSDMSAVEQRRVEIRLNRQAEVQNLHNSFGHPNNQALLQHCQHAKIGTKYLKRYILSLECAFCQAALGRRSYIKHKRKRTDLPPPTDTTPLPPSTPTIVPDVFLHPFKGSLLNITALSASKPVTITEDLSNACATCTVGPDKDVAYTDLRMDWGDACSLGRNGEQYFLLLVDKNTEYYVTFNTATRDSPVALLQEYINFTGKPIRFLRVDNAKEFTCPGRVDLCNANNIILQVVVSYNHLMQARVEGAIGICKQHTRVALAVEHAPTRF